MDEYDWKLEYENLKKHFLRLQELHDNQKKIIASLQQQIQDLQESKNLH